MAKIKKIVIPEGKVCDYIDGKFRNDTPEEYVRQTIEKRLVNEHRDLPKQVRVEFTLQLGSRKPRADIVIFESDCLDPLQQSQDKIKIIIEVIAYLFLLTILVSTEPSSRFTNAMGSPFLVILRDAPNS